MFALESLKIHSLRILPEECRFLYFLLKSHHTLGTEQAPLSTIFNVHHKIKTNSNTEFIFIQQTKIEITAHHLRFFLSFVPSSSLFPIYQFKRNKIIYCFSCLWCAFFRFYAVEKKNKYYNGTAFFEMIVNVSLFTHSNLTLTLNAFAFLLSLSHRLLNARKRSFTLINDNVIRCERSRRLVQQMMNFLHFFAVLYGIFLCENRFFKSIRLHNHFQDNEMNF